MRLTAQFQPNKQGRSRTADRGEISSVFWCFCISGVGLVTGRQADHLFLCFSGFVVTGSPTDRWFLFFGCCLVTGGQADRCF